MTSFGRVWLTSTNRSHPDIGFETRVSVCNASFRVVVFVIAKYTHIHTNQSVIARETQIDRLLHTEQIGLLLKNRPCLHVTNFIFSCNLVYIFDFSIELADHSDEMATELCYHVITSAKMVIFYPAFVCLSVC